VNLRRFIWCAPKIRRKERENATSQMRMVVSLSIHEFCFRQHESKIVNALREYYFLKIAPLLAEETIAR